MRAVVFSLLTLSALLVLVVGCAPATSAPLATPPPATAIPTQVESAGPWQIVLQKEIEQPMRIAAFLDETFGLTGGPADVGRANVTTDGGQTWTLAQSSAGCLFGLDVVDGQVIWQCSLGPVGVSTDGGQTWQAVTDYGNCRQLSFLDAQTGWIATPYQLGATTDGGQTWAEVSLPEGVDNIAAVSRRTPTDGYLLDNTGILHVTQDGGQSWSSHALGLDLEGKPIPNRETASAAVRFTDADHGLVVVHLAGGLSSEVVALRTADGGRTWEQEQVMEVSLLNALYLSHDGSVLTIADQMEEQVIVLRYTE
jgi:photosystem II stability/assembly factor-like uncharacterized protein